MFLKLAKQSNDSIIEGGVSFFNFYSWIEAQHKDMMLE